MCSWSAKFDCHAGRWAEIHLVRLLDVNGGHGYPGYPRYPKGTWVSRVTRVTRVTRVLAGAKLKPPPPEGGGGGELRLHRGEAEGVSLFGRAVATVPLAG